MKNFKQKSSEPEAKDLKLQAPNITEYMVSRDLITFKPETKISVVIKSLLENRITGAPVLNEKDEVVGLIDDKHCLNVLFASAYYNHPNAHDTVDGYMTDEYKTISINSDMIDVANSFIKTKFKRLLVMDEKGKLVGQISVRDVLRAIKDLNTNTW